VVDRDKMRPGFGWDHSASSYFYSYIIAYDAKPLRRQPAHLDGRFLRCREVPRQARHVQVGRRHVGGRAAGRRRAPDELYPLDLDRAHAKIEAFKDNVVAYWGGGAESQSLLLNGEASMALVWSTRAKLIEEDSGGDGRSSGTRA
jgi:putative spermidine/putrescine transport system substrate-binding protein